MTEIGARLAALPADRLALLARRRSQAVALPPVDVADDGTTPSSPTQERLWFLNELHDGSTTIVPTAFRLTGPLDRAAIVGAVADLSRRHEALRTTFEPSSDGLRQRLHADLPPEIEVLELGPDDDLAELLRGAAARPFDLQRGPLLRATLVAITPDEHVLQVAADHVAVDGASLTVLGRDLAARYRARHLGEADHLPDAASGYAAASALLRARATPDATSSPSRRRPTALEPTSVPFDLAISGPPRAATIVRRLVAETLDAAEHRCSEEGATLFSFLLAAVASVLGPRQHEAEVTIATVASGRTHPALQDMVGCFVNTIAVTVAFDDRQAFRDAWRDAHEQTTLALAEQDVPLEVDRRTAGVPDRANDTDTEVLLLLQPPYHPVELDGLVVQPIALDPPAPTYPLAFEVRPDGDGSATLALQYDATRYESSTATALVEQVVELVARAGRTPDVEVGNLARTTVAEEGLPGTPSTLDVTDLLERPVRAGPDAVAVVDGDRAVTFAALHEAAQALAADLAPHANPISRCDSVVALVMDRSIELAVAVVAVLRVGSAFVIVDPGLDDEAIIDLIDRSGAAVVLTVEDYVDRVPSNRSAKVVDLRPRCAPASPALSGRRRHRPDAPAYVLATSGSTGRPKLVVGTHRGLVNRIRWDEDRFGWPPGARVGHKTPVAFVDCLWELLGPLSGGRTLVVVRDGVERDAQELLELLAEQEVTHLVGVPTLLRGLAERAAAGATAVPPLIRITSSGEPLPGRLAAELRAVFPAASVLNLYGMSEASADSAAHVVVDGDTRRLRIPVGEPVGRTALTVRRPDGAAVDREVVGGLHLGGDGLALGYLGQPGATADAFRPAPDGPPGARELTTGDRARRRTSGELEVLGRADHQVKIGGRRIDLSGVEALATGLPGVRRAAAVARDDHGTATTLALYLQPESSTTLDEVAVRAALSAWLPRGVRPRVTVLAALPMTPTGKVDRRRLPTPVRRPVTGGDAVDPAVAGAFRTVLGVEDPTSEDDFFALGGDSILAARLAEVLLRETGRRLRLAALFEHPTVDGIARVLAASPAVAAPTAVVAQPDRWFDPYPLTPVQEAYWVGRRTDQQLGNVATHGYVEIEMSELDPARLEAAVQDLVARHHLLRTVVHADGRQVTLAEVPRFELGCTRLVDADERDVVAHLDRVRDEMSHQVLPTDRWPLFDLRVSLLPAGRARIHVSMDALICDVQSWRILVRELARRYRDPGAPLPELPLTFRDWVVNHEPEPQELAAAEAYWATRIEDMPAGPDLPIRCPLDEIEAPRFTRRAGRLSATAWARLRDRAASAAVTPSALLLTLYAEVLRSWSSRDDFTIVLTVFDRPPAEPALAAVVGDFTTITPVTVDGRSGAGFDDRVRAVQRSLWEALDHGAVSGVTVLRDWAARHRRSGDAAMNVVFTSALDDSSDREDAPEGPDGPDDGPLGTTVFAISQTPQVLLDHQATVVDGELVFTWDGVDDAFPPGVLDDAFDAYVRRLDALAGSGEPTPILSASTTAVREAMNATDGPVPDVRLDQLVRRQIERGPEATAVIAGDRRLTYGELGRRVDELAARLRQAGVRRGDLVAVSMVKSWEQIVAVLGILHAGAAYVPIDPGLPATRIEHLHRRCASEVCVVRSEDGPPPGLPNGVDVITVGDEDGADPSPRVPVPQAETGTADDIAYVIFTSGSTGEPKGVVVTHRSAANTVVDMNERFGVGPADRVLALSSLSFDLSVYDVFGLLAAGGAVVVPDASSTRDPRHWLDQVVVHRVTMWNSVPALAQLAVEAVDRRPGALDSLRLVLMSGDWIPVTLPGRLSIGAPGARLVSLGGATEAAIWSILHDIEAVDPSWPSIPYGRPMRNQRFHVLDPRLEPRPDWVPGELHIGGIGLAQCYWDDPVRTAERFFVHPTTGEQLYRTGDLGRYHPDGTIEFLGRDDFQVKISGYRIELGEVEAALLQLPGITGAVATVVGDPRGDRRLAAYVVTDGGTVDPPAVRTQLAHLLPAYAIPSHVIGLDALPLTSNGKVDRGALPDPSHRSPSPATAGLEMNELEAQLADAWALLLGVDQIGLDDSFFALGGTSVVAIRLVERLEERFDVDLRLKRLYQSPTVRELAAAIAAGPRRAHDDGSTAPLADDHASRHEPFPLTDVQAAYWLGRRAGLALGGVATHGYSETDIIDLDIDRLETAMRHLVDRHEMLRAVVLDDGTQMILPDPPPYRITRTDLRSLDAETRERRLLEIREARSHEVADPSRWPLVELHATQIDDRTTRLHAGVDLLIGDARSFQILHQELSSLYGGHAADALPRIGCSFRDYVLAMEGRRGSREHAEALRFWEAQVASMPAGPSLPYEPGAASLRSPRFQRLSAHLDREDWGSLRAAAARSGLTASGVLCAAFAEVLRRFSESAAFTLNVTTLDRQPLHPDVDALVGDFTSTTFLVVDSGGATFAARAQDLQARLWDALDHRLVSGVEVLRLLRRDPARRGLATMPIVFTSTLTGHEAEGVGLDTSWEGETVFTVSQTPQVLLDHQVFEHDGELIYSWDHVPEAFPPGFVADLFEAYRHLLGNLAVELGALVDVAAASVP